MFREMRLSKQALTNEEAVKILETCGTGILAVSGDDDYPYAVPLNFTYEDGKIMFHCANEGHKIDGIKRNDKVSLCVIEKDDVDAEELNTDYRSVIVFGRARILTGDDERRAALEKIGRRFSAEFEERIQMEIKNEWDNVAIVEIRPELIMGKQGSGLI
ncbi:pyridoxamine 5'-phosphate oxidase family protein [Bacillota bacterium]